MSGGGGADVGNLVEAMIELQEQREERELLEQATTCTPAIALPT